MLGVFIYCPLVGVSQQAQLLFKDLSEYSYNRSSDSLRDQTFLYSPEPSPKSRLGASRWGDTDDEEIGDVEHHCQVRGPAEIPPLQIPEASRLINGGSHMPPTPLSEGPGTGEDDDALMQLYQQQFGDAGMSPRSDESFEVVSSKGKAKKGVNNLSVSDLNQEEMCIMAIGFIQLCN